MPYAFTQVKEIWMVLWVYTERDMHILSGPSSAFVGKEMGRGNLNW